MDLAQINRHARVTAAVCAIMLVIFAAISYSAVLTKNATIDEPTQALSGWLIVRKFDFRVETVSPPLWECFAAIGNLLSNPPLVHDSPIWRNCSWDPIAEVIWSAQTLYDSPGFDGDAFINRGRAMMLVFGIALGALIARWSFQLAGPVAAVVATALYCLDPNIIAHAPLVKGDVPFAFILLALAYLVWLMGRRATLIRLFLVALVCGLALNVKFSGVLVGPILAILLLLRSVLPEPWMFRNSILRGMRQRFVAGALVGIVAAISCFVVTWACYGFRYRPAPVPDVRMDMQAIYARAQRVETTAELGRPVSPAEIAAHPPGAIFRFVRWADTHHVLPQAMLAGFLYQHACVQYWQEFLNGRLYGNGRTSYFPLAMIYKTPVCELISFAVAMLVLAAAAIRNHRAQFWSIACLLIPFVCFGVAALTTHLNIGYRNVLPLLPFVQIACGVAAAICWRNRRRTTAVIVAILIAGLAAETLSAWPDYIAFFNFPTGGWRGGIRHLGDSNLDWGQDIASLARWQRAHNDVPLWTDLYYSVDPKFYGLNGHPITIGDSGKIQSDVTLKDGLIAVSATHLQGLYIKPQEAEFYNRLRQMNPIAVIGGTIYIYPFNPSLF